MVGTLLVVGVSAGVLVGVSAGVLVGVSVGVGVDESTYAEVSVGVASGAVTWALAPFKEERADAKKTCIISYEIRFSSATSFTNEQEAQIREFHSICCVCGAEPEHILALPHTRKCHGQVC